jgi:hypothetical protein
MVQVMISPKQIANFMRDKTSGWRFIGISDDEEVFIEQVEEVCMPEPEVAQMLREAFPMVGSITVVVKPSIGQVEQMVEDLNKMIGDLEKAEKLKPTPDLLDIGKF